MAKVTRSDSAAASIPASSRRRQFLKAAGATVAAAGVEAGSVFATGSANAASTTTQTSFIPYHRPQSAPDSLPAGRNIIFILTDQERYFDSWPFPVPGRESLQRDGITFTNHQIASCICSPSRSTIYTGQHTQQTGVLDNAGLPWQPSMSTDIRTVGHMMKDAGYYSAYLGKWHLSHSMHKTHSQYDAPVSDYNETMKAYGFDDYFGVGDLIGMVRGGYNFDGVTTESAVGWLKSKASRLQTEKKPWFLAVILSIRTT